MSLKYWVGAFVVVLGASPAACNGEVSGTGGGSTTSTTSSGGQGTPCGGLAGATCPSDQYCFWPDGSCGAGDNQGVCTKMPMACAVAEAVPWEVCGCDGHVYEDSCNAAQSGSDISNNGGCNIQKGQIACGPLVCVESNQYCVHTISDVSGEPDGYNCSFVPPDCSLPVTCDCLAGEPCGSNCAMAADGSVTLTCPGG